MEAKAFVINEPKKGSLKNFTIPELEADEVLIKVKACGVCTTDRRIFAGEINVPLPVIGGHEISGEIIKVGEDIDDLKVGNQVAVDAINRCGYCFFCVRKMDNQCINSKKARNINGTFLIAGGFSEYLISKRKQIFVPTKETDFISLSLSEPVACCLHSVKKASLVPGNSALIIGAGTMGILHALILKAFGVSPIISEPNKERRDFASKLGITTITPEECSKMANIVNNGYGFDAAFVTAPDLVAINDSINFTRKMGTIIIYTSLHPSSDMRLDINHIHYTEKKITGSEGRTMEDFDQAVTMISKRIIDVSSLVTKTISLENLSKELFNKPHGKEQRTIVVPEL